LPLPTTTGKTISRYSSTRSCGRSDSTDSALPSIINVWSDCLSLATAAGTSPSSSVAFHFVSVRVVDATYLPIPFIRSAKPCSSLATGHAAAKPS